MKEEFTARMLRVHFGEDDRWQGKPLHEAILAKCKELGIEEAIVFPWHRGLRRGQPHSPCQPLAVSKDAPIQMSIIGTEEQIGKLTPYLDAMVEEGLVAASTVEVVRYSRTPERS
jgi:PII-like signaling protein